MTGKEDGQPNHEKGPDGTIPVPHRVLDTANRRTAGAVYLIAAMLALGLIAATGTSLMWLTAVLPLLGIAGYQFVAGKHIRTTDMQAIQIASVAVPFDVGHASATLGFTGFMAKPVWQVLVFEAGSAPHHQALVTVDALSAEVTGSFAEAVEAV
jgi:hypothetical protein